MGEKRSVAARITCIRPPTDGACRSSSGLWHGQDPSLPSLERARGRRGGLSRVQENMGEYVALNTYYRRRRLPFLQEKGEPESEQDGSQPGGTPSLPTGGPPDNTAHAGVPHPRNLPWQMVWQLLPESTLRERDACGSLVVTHSWSNPRSALCPQLPPPPPSLPLAPPPSWLDPSESCPGPSSDP